MFVVTPRLLVRVKGVVERKPKLEDLQGGDQHAFQQVYDHHGPRLYRFLLRLSGNPTVAQDLLRLDLESRTDARIPSVRIDQGAKP